MGKLLALAGKKKENWHMKKAGYVSCHVKSNAVLLVNSGVNNVF